MPHSVCVQSDIIFEWMPVDVILPASKSFLAGYACTAYT